jgi:hypothetical protein
MRFAPSDLLLPFVSCALACSGSGPPPENVGGGASTSIDDESVEMAVHPWKATSTHLVVETSPGWRVSSRFEADREQLREEQLQALDHVEGGANPRCFDCDHYDLTVTDADGSVATYTTASGFAAPPFEIRRDSLQAFLGTFYCYESPVNHFGGEDRDPLVAQWETAPTISSLDSACWHGIIHHPCEDIRFWLSVERPGSYRVAVDECTPDLSIEFLSEDMTMLASVASTTSGCPVVSHDFEEAGSYALLLRRPTNGACDELTNKYYHLTVSEAPP